MSGHCRVDEKGGCPLLLSVVVPKPLSDEVSSEDGGVERHRNGCERIFSREKRFESSFCSIPLIRCTAFCDSVGGNSGL